jgi:hypothetical protein
MGINNRGVMISELDQIPERDVEDSTITHLTKNSKNNSSDRISSE